MNMENSVWKLLEDLSSKKGITEIAINGPRSVFVERSGQFIQLNVNIKLEDIQEFISDVANHNNKLCNEDSPILDGNLPDGSRINIVNTPFVSNSPAISIRKYLKSIKSFDASPGVFELSNYWVEFLKAVVSARANMIVSGGTGVGKTTFMNLLLQEMSPAERVVTIEDALELSINNPNTVRLESRLGASTIGAKVSTRDLVKNTLRMRPDRIIIGEVRGEELFDLLQAMNTGHDGSMSSVHANSPSECLSRLETLFLLAGYDVPQVAVRKQISDAVDFVIQISRNREGKRVVSKIMEITGMEGGNFLAQDIARYEEGSGLVATGIVPVAMEKIHLMGGLPMDYFSEQTIREAS